MGSTHKLLSKLSVLSGVEVGGIPGVAVECVDIGRNTCLLYTSTTETVPIDKGIDIWHNFGTQYFLERREIGIFNIGGAGSITADGVKLSLIHI